MARLIGTDSARPENALCERSRPLDGPEPPPAAERLSAGIAERLLDFERHDAAWPHAVAEHATFDLKSAPRAVRT